VGSPYQQPEEGKGNASGGEENGPWAAFGRRLDSVPGAFYSFSYFLSLFLFWFFL
jgi:hypothetical protein